MSKLKVDNFYQFFNVFVILIISHNKEGIDISMRKAFSNNTLACTLLDYKNYR